MANETKTLAALPPQATEQTKPTVVASFMSDSPIIKAMLYVTEIAKKNGFGPLKGEHSVQYWTEEFVAKACEYYKGAIERDADRRNREAFCKAEAALVLPDAATATPEDWKRYGMAQSALRRKYGIGGTQAEV